MARPTGGIAAKLARAHEHIEDFDARVRAFHRGRPYRIALKTDADAGERVYELAHVEPVPLDIGAVVGDALSNLRAALDHAAHLIEADPATGEPEHLVYFPIGVSAADYVAKRRGYIRRGSEAFVDALDAIEPYQGGQGHQLWVLKQLNNADKHRRLLLGVGSYQGLELTQFGFRAYERAGIPFDVPEVMLRPRDRLCPLQAGDELWREPLDMDVNEDLEFALEVALDEPGVVECESASRVLRVTADRVRDALRRLEPLFDR